MRKRLLVLLVLFVYIMDGPSPVFADEHDTARLLERANTLALESRFDEAISVWLSAVDRLSGRELAKVRKKLGLAFRNKGRLPEAWHFLSLYLASPEGRDDSMVRGWFNEVEESLRKIHVRISISCSPEDASIRIPSTYAAAGLIARQCPVVWWFRPGSHEVRLDAVGFPSRTFEVAVLERDDPGVRELVLIPRPKPSRSVEWALIGSGLALGAVGGVVNGIGWKVNSDLKQRSDTQAEYDRSRRKQVRPMEIAAYTLYGVAGAAALAGIITWAGREPEGSTEGLSGVTVSPMMMPGGTGALMTFEF